jgi:hypothetical protein
MNPATPDGQLRRAALAFLAARAPAAYTAHAIAARVARSGLLDASPDAEAIERELRTLARDNLVVVAVDPTTFESGWYATPEGVQRWVLDGRPMIG